MSAYAPLLAELSVGIINYGFIDNHQQQNNSVCNYTDFIGGFTILEKLHAEHNFTKDIELNEVKFEDMKHISLVARLLVGAPNLQKLVISSSYFAREDDDDASDVPHVSFSDFGCAPNFKLENLRVVKMRGMKRVVSLPQMAFISFLLERSPVLETMSLGGLSSNEKQYLSAELEVCSRASPNVKLAITMF